MAGLANPVVLTGDIHVQLVADVPGDDGTVAATELVTSSISSRSDDAIGPLVPLLPTVAPDILFGKDSRGWLRCDVTPETWTATFFDVADPSTPDSPVTEGARFVVTAGTRGAVPA
jgi:alkaline phosphatase D